MIARAVAKYVRMSPRKVRYVMAPLRRRTVAEALSLLAVANRRAAKPLAKTIASAFANAKQADPTLSEQQLIVSRLTADGGPVWKRFRPAAFGRAVKIRKPTTHITVELDRKSEIRSQRSEVRGQKTEGTGQRTEGRRHRSAVGKV